MGRIAQWMGQGPSIVLIHGNAPPDSLRPLAVALASTFRVGAVHRMGYGDEGPAEPASDASRALLAELEASGVECFHLAGHSYGAYVALRLALDAPRRVERLSLLSPLTGVPTEEAALYQGGAAALRAGEDLSELLASRWHAPAHLATRPDATDHIRTWLEETRMALADDIGLTATEPDLTPAAAALRIPTLVRVGALDVATPPGRARALASSIPGARFEQVEGVGHLLAQEDLAGTSESLRRFHCGDREAP